MDRRGAGEEAAEAVTFIAVTLPTHTCGAVILPDGRCANGCPPLYEVVQVHPATCRVNLLCWDVTEPEAARVLRELQDAQRARQGAIISGGKTEMGWSYIVRPQGRPEAPGPDRRRRPTRKGRPP